MNPETRHSPSPREAAGRGDAAAVLRKLGYQMGATTRRLRAYTAPTSGRLVYLARAGARCRIILPDGSRSLAEAILKADPRFAHRVVGEAPLGTPGGRLTFSDEASFEAFLVAFDTRE